jgi:hypothetical protein
MYLQTCWSASPLRLCGLLLFVSPDDCLLLVILPESITQSTLSSLPSSNEPLLSIGGGGVGGGGGVAWSPHAQLIVAKLVPTMKVMWRLGFVWEEMRRARPLFIYAGGSRGLRHAWHHHNFVGRVGRRPLSRRGITINMM